MKGFMKFLLMFIYSLLTLVAPVLIGADLATRSLIGMSKLKPQIILIIYAATAGYWLATLAFDAIENEKLYKFMNFQK